MEKKLCENQTITSIVQMLTKEGEFSEVGREAVELAGECIKADGVAIFQADNEELIKIVEWKNAGKCGNRLSTSYSVFCDETVIVNEPIACEKYKEELSELGAEKLVVCPIEINEEVSLYIVFFLLNKEKVFSQLNITFMKNVATVLQAIAQRKVINNSLLCSYNALQDVLNNVGCDITVYDSVTGEIQFENMKAREDKNSQMIVDECARWYFDEKQQGNDNIDVIEKYCEKNKQWYEVKFSELKWVNDRDVTMCTVFNITQKKKNIEKIKFQAQNDFLTGLYNRMKCEADLQNIINEARDMGDKAALLFLDLDDFKRINDGLGHQYGDILLQEIATGLQSVRGLAEHCYRMGGDEFVAIIVPEMHNEMHRIIDNIMTMFNSLWYIMDAECYCTVSMGIVEFPAQGETVNELIKKADVAMYSAKKSGKNTYAFYKADEDTSARRFDVENNMRQAIAEECEEFVVHYQPVMEIEGEKCIGCEALVRWNSRAFGLMTPIEFIPLAEYLGLITNIGDFVLEKACMKCKEWNEKYDPNFKMSINLSVVQLLQNNLVNSIKEILERTEVNPKNIILEITETLAINDIARVVNIIEGIKDLGISIALDDFGTGYSSLNYIKELHLDIIKVDRTFVEDIEDEDYELVFIKLITDMAKKLNIKICIEGVEREEQIKVLKTVDVDWFQGFYYSMPVAEEEFEKRFLFRIEKCL